MPEDERPDFELSLDFADTIDWRNGRLGKIPKDSLTGYDKLVEWSVEHRLVKGEEAKRLIRLAKDSGKDKSTFKRAIDLREAIYRIFSATAHRRRPESRDLQILNGFVSESLAKSRIVRAGDGFQWSWRGVEESPDMILWPIARSAADLLTSERLENVGECANEEEGCGWLFLDCSKRHNQKWCSTSGCGNRAKVRRFYEAHRGEQA